jgi:hypothetical protein
VPSSPDPQDPLSQPFFPLFSLPAGLIRTVATCLPRNEVAASFKATCKDARQLVADFATLHCAEPVPPHALVWKWSQSEAVKGLTRDQREEVARLAVESGSEAAVVRLVTGEAGVEGVGALGLAPQGSFLEAAAAAGHLALCQRLQRHGCACGSTALLRAASAGRTDVCLWLLAEGCAPSSSAVEAAARSGHAGTVLRLLAAGCAWSPLAAGMAAGGGHAQLMRQLLQLSAEQPKLRPTNAADLLARAAAGLDLPDLQALYAAHVTLVPEERRGGLLGRMLQRVAMGCAEGYEGKIDWLLGMARQAGLAVSLSDAGVLAWTQGTCSSGAELLARLNFLRQRGFSLGAETAEYVLSGAVDEAEALAWVLEEAGLETGAGDAPNVAGSRGHLRSLQLLRDRGCLGGEQAWELLEVCRESARGGRSAEWLLGELFGPGGGRTPLSEGVFATVAGFGSIALLAGLRERGSPWGGAAWGFAAASGCVALLEWLHSQGPLPVSRGAGRRTPAHSPGWQRSWPSAHFKRRASTRHTLAAPRQGAVRLATCAGRGCRWQRGLQGRHGGGRHRHAGRAPKAGTAP